GGAGTDTALETADIALMSDHLDKLPYTIGLSRKNLKIIFQNVAFALGLTLLDLLLIIPGWLTLWMAMFADMGATLIV
ncbi:cation-transporting P-type ATPase, partial [Planococcus sp. SIMBA_160]